MAPEDEGIQPGEVLNALLGVNTPEDAQNGPQGSPGDDLDAKRDESAVDNEPVPGVVVLSDPFGANVELPTLDTGDHDDDANPVDLDDEGTPR